jgi:hypothetical protein
VTSGDGKVWPFTSSGQVPHQCRNRTWRTGSLSNPLAETRVISDCHPSQGASTK